MTTNLNEGPIIEQDTIRVTHAQSADGYARLGRDVEAQVLARAVHAHVHRRAFRNGTKTVVFPASPGGLCVGTDGLISRRKTGRVAVSRPRPAPA